MSANGLILVVDDELRSIQAFIDELEIQGYTVICASTVEECRGVLARASGIRLVILDMMLPPGERPAALTGEGIHTGLRLLSEIRSTFPTLPVLLFTNVDVRRLQFVCDSYTHLIEKCSVFPFELPAEVRKLISE